MAKQPRDDQRKPRRSPQLFRHSDLLRALRCAAAARQRVEAVRFMPSGGFEIVLAQDDAKPAAAALGK